MLIGSKKKSSTANERRKQEEVKKQSKDMEHTYENEEIEVSNDDQGLEFHRRISTPATSLTRNSMRDNGSPLEWGEILRKLDTDESRNSRSIKILMRSQQERGTVEFPNFQNKERLDFSQ
ncbi:hypothetical protein U1Q18_005597 [Sarracenia purpurea var. burkii]